MPTQIRHAIFETNSSSCHSISFSDKWPDIDHVSTPTDRMALTGGMYGWGPEVHRSHQSKADYAYTYARLVEHDDPSRGKELLDMIDAVILDVTGHTPRMSHLPEDDSWTISGYNYGHIDHQSFRESHDLGNEIFASHDTLKAFIFDPSTLLVIDHDNH